jgi:acyl-CoA synthetase (NDP forming)
VSSTLPAFHDPRSVAVVGASGNPAKWGYWLASGALAGGARRHVRLVNRRAAEVLGAPCFPSLADLDVVPELVALCVPAAHVPAVVAEGLALGVRGFLGITAGVPDEAALATAVRDHGARLVGPNSLGLFDAATDLHLSWGTFTAGPLAVISQSGQLGSEIGALAARAGLGVSRFVSIGNQVDVTAAELLEDLVHHEDTRAVALYLEGFGDGARLRRAIRDLRAAGKHTLVLTIGAGEASRRAARSHTGSLTSSLDAVDALCRAAGAVRVSTPSELVDVTRVLLRAPLPRGRRVAVVGDSGGQGGVAADVLGGRGLAVPALSAGLGAALAGALPVGAAVSNPVDLAGGGEQDLGTYAGVVGALLGSGEVDAVVLTGYFGCYGADTPSLAGRELEIAARLGELAASADRPLVIHSMRADSAVVAALEAHGVPAFADIDGAARGLAGAAALACDEGRSVVEPPPVAMPVESGYWPARELLAAHGVSFPAGRVLRTPDDAPAAVAALRAPYVLKAGWLDHKTEVGGVVLGLRSPGEVREALVEMQRRLGPGEYVVEEQDARPHGVEVLVGFRRDPALGPLVLVGAGGTEAELRRDVAVEIAPVTPDVARDMVERLRCLPLLCGWRGRPATDVEALVAVVVAVSELGASRGAIAELELNPVRVAPSGAVAVDALIVRGQSRS